MLPVDHGVQKLAIQGTAFIPVVLVWVLKGLVRPKAYNLVKALLGVDVVASVDLVVATAAARRFLVRAQPLAEQVLGPQLQAEHKQHQPDRV